MNTKLSFLVAGCLTLTASASIALADVSVQRLLLRNGVDCGPYNMNQDGDNPLDQVYPGGEQGQSVVLGNGKIATIWMNSCSLPADGGGLPANRMQTACAITEMTAAGPVITAGPVSITNNNGNQFRNANHPIANSLPVSVGGTNHFVAEYGYVPNNEAQKYAMVVNDQCQVVSNTEVTMAKNNDNCSSSGQNSSYVYKAEGNTAYIIGAHGCNGNGEDDSWLATYSVTNNGNGTFEVDSISDDIRTETREERTRPNIIAMGDYTVDCLSAGNNQPPDYGVVCSAYNPNNGQQIWREYVECSRNICANRAPGGDYATKILVNPLSTNTATNETTAVLQWARIDKDGNDKGDSVGVMQVVKFTPNGMERLTSMQRMTDFVNGIDTTHPTMSSGLYGYTGEEVQAFFLLDSSFNGNYNSISKIAVGALNAAEGRLYTTGNIALPRSIDNQWLSNLYGNNPNTQGRNFIQMKSNIPNPNYGVDGAWMSTTKYFTLVTAHTRLRNESLPYGVEPKLATELHFVPTVFDREETPLVDPPDESPLDEPGADPVEEPVEDPAPTEPTEPAPGVKGACSASSSTGSLVGFGLILFALVSVTRRRNQA